MKLLQNKEPVIEFMEENLLTSMDWFKLINSHKIKRYSVLYRGEEKIYINPEIENSKEISEIILALLKQKRLNQKTCRLLYKAGELTDKETQDYLLMIWKDWRDKVAKLELNNQAESILKQMRSKRLYCKAKKNREIIKELFNIGFGLYSKEVKTDYQKGAENTFMYGYLLGIEESSSCISEKGGAAL